MRLLLDTHALIWTVMAPERLGNRARDAILNEDAEVYASHVSLWELTIKRRLGKLDQLGGSAIDWFDTHVERSNLRQLQISPRHLGAVEFLPLFHGDPFDRLLVVQASLERMSIVTADDLMSDYDVDIVW